MKNCWIGIHKSLNESEFLEKYKVLVFCVIRTENQLFELFEEKGIPYGIAFGDGFSDDLFGYSMPFEELATRIPKSVKIVKVKEKLCHAQ